MQIRRYRGSDARYLAEIFHAAVHRTAAFFYAPDQCAAWSPAPNPELFTDREADGRRVFVAAEDKTPLGFIEIEQNGHIDCFYVHPDAPRGTGTALFAALAQEALTLGLTDLHVEASEPAKRFFLRQGFESQARQEVTRKGVTLHNFRMTGPVPPSPSGA